MDGDLYRGRAPLRIGLAGGGTDVSPYCDEYGGAVLNATINLYAYATILPSVDNQVNFVAADRSAIDTLPVAKEYDASEGLRLHRGVYNHIIHEFNGDRAIPLTLITSVDSPFGSGLGSSSALTVAMIEAFRALLQLPLGQYDIADLAYMIERVEVGLEGGRQDQYAATFGGMNFMEFAAKNRVIVNPLALSPTVMDELESSLVLYFTGASRSSAEIIKNQVNAIRSGATESLEAMHQLKREALELKTALLRGELNEVADIFRRSWDAKKALTPGITNAQINEVYAKAIQAGALAGKISGAGGGGFMLFLVDPIDRERVVIKLGELGGISSRCSITHKGSTSWSIRQSSIVRRP